MDGLLKKAKGKLDKFIDTDVFPGQAAPQHHPHQQQDSLKPSGQQINCGVEQDQPSLIQEPTALDILRYRYHHGTNLGSIFVIERWLQPSRFPDGVSGSSELAAVQAWIDRVGIEATKQKFEEHWANAVTEADIHWLVNEAKCTTVRLPIGFFDLPDPSFTHGTPFKPYAYVYSGAWYNIRMLISRLRANGIGTLIDLHALPGGANKGEHSGTNSGTAGLWTSSVNRELGLRCCQYLACEVKSGLEIVGIQIVNEADWESERMYDWYDDCIAAVSEIDPTVPVIVSDGWNLGKAIEYCLGKNEAFPSQPICPVVIDTHFYWAFTDACKQKSPQQIIAEVDTKMSELAGKEGSVINRGAVQVIVGEYSVVLTEDSWAKCCGVPKEELVKQFGEAQSKRYQKKSGGAFFWTWKMDWMPGGEWGFKKQSDAKTRSLQPPACCLVPHCDIYSMLERANYYREERMRTAVNQHVNYWSRTSPNTPFEHWRYEYGWKVGYNDAYIFFAGRQPQAVGPANMIGNLELWALKRVRDCGFRGKFVWEFEQGLRKGIEDFNAMVGI